jgi:3-(3-hydroxy-phenyl)propionate hydroxylase
MTEVLIAGAGPVGLSAANALADAGVAVTVLEAEPRLPENLRASTFQPPTLDMLERFGAARRLIEMGRVAPTIQYRDRSGWVASFHLGAIAAETAHPYRVQCEQFRLNQVLLERLSSIKHAKVFFGSEVTGVSQDGGSVTVTVNGTGRLEAHYLIGADGGRSKVREALGIALEGFTWPDRFLVASTPFEFSDAIPGLCDVSYFADPEQWYFLLRVREVWRCMFPVPPEMSEAEVLSDAYIESRLQRVFSRSERYALAHRTLYSVHQRVAQRYREGRVFLAGDAAHLNNPLGGMGMNGGIHDAFSLSNVLLSVLKGGKSDKELDRYEKQRRPVALEYVNTITIANKRNLEAREPEEHRRWKETMSRAAADPVLAREYLLKISMIASLRKAEAS